MRPSRPLLFAAVVTVLAPLIAACGGDDAKSTTTDSPGNSTEDTTGGGDDGGDDGGNFQPGTDLYRVVNLLDEPVDLYASTTDGLVEAFLVQSGLAPGEVSDRYAPPDPGTLRVLTAGASDPTCVVTCPHILVNSRVSTDSGPVITEVLYLEGATVRSFTVWEEPSAGASANANRMPDPDPAGGLLIPLAVALTDADFGLQIADTAGTGCLTDRDASGVLVGGNQTPVFAYAGDSIEIVFHDNSDRDCTGEIVGGPFTVTGGAGSRTLLILTGSPGNMDASALSLGTDEAVPSDGNSDTAANAITALADFLFQAVPQLSAEDATCVATGMVNDLGADRFLDATGQPLDYANIGGADGDAFAASADAAATACGLELG